MIKWYNATHNLSGRVKAKRINLQGTNDIFKKSVSQLRLHAILSAAADVHTRKKASVLLHDYLHVDTPRDVCALFPLIVILIPKIVVFNMLCRKERVEKVAFF